MTMKSKFTVLEPELKEMEEEGNLVVHHPLFEKLYNEGVPGLFRVYPKGAPYVEILKDNISVVCVSSELRPMLEVLGTSEADWKEFLTRYDSGEDVDNLIGYFTIKHEESSSK